MTVNSSNSLFSPTKLRRCICDCKFLCLFVSLFLYGWMVVTQAFSIRICLVCNVKIDLSLFNV